MFFRDFVVLGKPKKNIEHFGILGSLKTITKDEFYSILSKYRDYERAFSRGRLKREKLFKEAKIEVGTVLIQIEGIDERRFNILKHVSPEILEVYGLSEEDVEPPTDNYKTLVERNFVPLEDILKSERKAMEIVMELEKQRLEKKYGQSGWRIEDVSLHEHYDIRVVEPSIERYIEVKGHKPLFLSAEITPAEYEFARKHKDRYWIYLVANLGKKKPVILKIFRPFESDSQVFAVLENGEEIEITENVQLTINEKTRRVLTLK